MPHDAYVYRCVAHSMHRTISRLANMADLHGDATFSKEPHFVLVSSDADFRREGTRRNATISQAWPPASEEIRKPVVVIIGREQTRPTQSLSLSKFEKRQPSMPMQVHHHVCRPSVTPTMGRAQAMVASATLIDIMFQAATLRSIEKLIVDDTGWSPLHVFGSQI